MWNDYVWIVVVGSFLAFFTAYGIGANDVANAFATSVGAKAVTLRQAIVIAGIFEFLGAVLLGSQVTDTVRKRIADQTAFEEDPEILMYGMVCVLAATGIWLTLASFMELPVSTTHSVIGGIVGMSMTFKGADAVVWSDYDHSKSGLNKFKGLAVVLASWVISPFLSGVFAALLFFAVRKLVLRHDDSEKRAFLFFPVLVGLTTAINVYFIVFKGFSRKIKTGGEEKGLKEILGEWVHLIAVVSALLSSSFVGLVVLPRLRDNIDFKRQRDLASGKYHVVRLRNRAGQDAARRVAFLDRDVHCIVHEDETVGQIHRTSEKFDRYTEEVFKYLQVFTAMCDSFAHGANDVANSIGPFAAIFMVYRKQEVDTTTFVPEWILVLGGAGIVTGLVTYGYNIIRAIGVRLIKVTASRGFAIELGATIVVILGSQYGTPVSLLALLSDPGLGIPLSTTHCQVGATVGVGLMEGMCGVNLWFLLRVIGGWLVTIVIVGGTTALFFAQGAYAPSILNLRTIERYEQGLYGISYTLADQLGNRAEVNAFNAEIEAGKNDDSAKQIAQIKEWLFIYSTTCPIN